MADEPIYVDTHFHVWELNRFKYQFPTPNLKSLYRDITLEEYGQELAQTPVKYAIFMQVNSRSAVAEADWIIESAKTYGYLKGVVAGFNLDDPKLADILDKYQQEKLFLGVRNILDYHEKDDWIVSGDAIKGISLLAERNIPYHILINDPKHWKYIPDLLKQFPEHKFIIDHMGKAMVLGDVRPGWEQWIAEVSKYPNVYCKLSSQLFPHAGPLTEAEKQGKFTDFDHKFVKHCLERFGVDRCMYGSDWPVCTLSGVASVKEFYDVSNVMLSHLTQQERDKIFGGNCIRFYDLKFP